MLGVKLEADALITVTPEFEWHSSSSSGFRSISSDHIEDDQNLNDDDVNLNDDAANLNDEYVNLDDYDKNPIDHYIHDGNLSNHSNSNENIPDVKNYDRKIHTNNNADRNSSNDINSDGNYSDQSNSDENSSDYRVSCNIVGNDSSLDHHQHKHNSEHECRDNQAINMEYVSSDEPSISSTSDVDENKMTDAAPLHSQISIENNEENSGKKYNDSY